MKKIFAAFAIVFAIATVITATVVVHSDQAGQNCQADRADANFCPQSGGA